MPMHDWSKTPAGVFHHFHQDWSVEIARSLNRGLLPKGLFALVEQKTPPREADVLAIETFSRPWDRDIPGGVATMERPKTRIIRETEQSLYVRKANLITVSHQMGHPVAVIEIVSPGNKSNKRDFKQFIDKTLEYFAKDVHVLIVDVFPPTKRDPYGVHKVIWDEVADEPFELPPNQNRLLASYEVGLTTRAFVETIGVGDAFPPMPLFLESNYSIRVPLEDTYQTAWDACPELFREAVLNNDFDRSAPE